MVWLDEQLLLYSYLNQRGRVNFLFHTDFETRLRFYSQACSFVRCYMKIQGIMNIHANYFVDVDIFNRISESFFFKVHRIHHLRTMNVCTKCHGNPSNSCWDNRPYKIGNKKHLVRLAELLFCSGRNLNISSTKMIYLFLTQSLPLVHFPDMEYHVNICLLLLINPCVFGVVLLGFFLWRTTPDFGISLTWPNKIK